MGLDSKHITDANNEAKENTSEANDLKAEFDSFFEDLDPDIQVLDNFGVELSVKCHEGIKTLQEDILKLKECEKETDSDLSESIAVVESEISNLEDLLDKLQEYNESLGETEVMMKENNWNNQAKKVALKRITRPLWNCISKFKRGSEVDNFRTSFWKQNQKSKPETPQNIYQLTGPELEKSWEENKFNFCQVFGLQDFNYLYRKLLKNEPKSDNSVSENSTIATEKCKKIMAFWRHLFLDNSHLRTCIAKGLDSNEKITLLEATINFGTIANPINKNIFEFVQIPRDFFDSDNEKESQRERSNSHDKKAKENRELEEKNQKTSKKAEEWELLATAIVEKFQSEEDLRLMKRLALCNSNQIIEFFEIIKTLDLENELLVSGEGKDQDGEDQITTINRFLLCKVNWSQISQKIFLDIIQVYKEAFDRESLQENEKIEGLLKVRAKIGGNKPDFVQRADRVSISNHFDKQRINQTDPKAPSQ